MDNQHTDPDHPACANPDCASGEIPRPGYDDCEACAWEAHLARVTAEMRARIAALEGELDTRADPHALPTALRALDAAVADKSRTFGERNAARAHRAARLLSLGDATVAGTIRPDQIERAAIVQAMADLLHCGEGAGVYTDELISDAVRQHRRDVDAEAREIWHRRDEIQVRCPSCGQQRQQAKRWHEPCGPCRSGFGSRDERISDDPSEANRQRALLVEDTLDGFAARTGQRGSLAHADNEVRAEVMRDFYCNLGHFADEWGLDFDQIATDGRAVYREEHAEAADHATD